MADVVDNVGASEAEAVDAGVRAARVAMKWTPRMSTFVLGRFAELVGDGLRTDKGFKEVHVNAVAKALTEFIGFEVTGTQVYIHMRKWRQKWYKVCKLKDLSGALWDETRYMIVLDEEHYVGHTKDHPKDAEYLNTPIENYIAMQIIFASGQASGRFAMSSNECFSQNTALGVDEGVSAPRSQPINLDSPEGESSKQTNLEAADEKGKGVVTNLKRKRTCEDEYMVMLGITDAVNKVANALLVPQHNEVHCDLYDSVMKTPGFSEEALMFALSYLLKNKAEGLCFLQMTRAHRALWLRTYLSTTYYL